LFLACSSGSHDFDESVAGTGTTAGSSGAAGSSSAGTSGTSQGGSSSGACNPGDTKDCFESPDGASFGAVPTKAVGSCKIGVRTCTSQAAWGACLGAVAPEAEDSCEAGNDANCNELPNEGCSCATGDTRDCGTDEGDCVKGTQSCANEVWGACEGEVKAATTDTCEEGNDANCNGSPNNGCECINGAKQPCGIDTGNCEKGEQTCTNGVWGACTGGVVAQAKDKCAPVGDDSNCNGSANETCDCEPGETRPCAKCGTQTCGADGKWPTACTGSKECEPGDVKTGTTACGNCGTQSTKQTCSSSCTYGSVQNVGGCLGSGPCQPGVTADQTQNVSCGNCGTQKQTRSCTAACDWPANWTSSGSCTGSGCVPGSTQPETVQPCGYCGEQEKQRICDQNCKLGPIVDKGSCKQNECSLMPGDERVGYVVCIHPAPNFNTVCLPSQKCCLSTQGSYDCKAACDATEKYSPCDGPEDCGGSLCCSRYDTNENTYAYCTTDCEFLTRCHADSDCPATWHCSKYTSGSYANGVCYPAGSNP
jgi:hypothetical protein